MNDELRLLAWQTRAKHPVGEWLRDTRARSGGDQLEKAFSVSLGIQRSLSLSREALEDSWARAASRYEFMLPLPLCCLTAYGVAEWFKVPGIYESLGERSTRH